MGFYMGFSETDQLNADMYYHLNDTIHTHEKQGI